MYEVDADLPVAFVHTLNQSSKTVTMRC